MIGQRLECMSTWLEDVRKRKKPRVVIYIIVGRNATKVIELLVFDSHTHSKFTVKRHFIMCWRLVLLIGILKKNQPLLVFVFERKNCLRGFSVVRAVQLPHAEDTCSFPQFLVSTNVTDGWCILQKCLAACESVVSFPVPSVLCVRHTLRPGRPVFPSFCSAAWLGMHFLFTTLWSEQCMKRGATGPFITAAVWLISKSRGDQNM